MDRRSVLKLAAGAAALEIAASAGPAAAAVESKGSSGKDYGPALEALRRYAQAHIAAHGLPGLTVAIADGDGYLANFQLGLADVDKKIPVGPQHLFQIGSISKSFTAILILQAVEAGKLGLDDAVVDRLPGIDIPVVPKVTIRHLLNHSSGLPDDPPFFPRGAGGGLWLGYEPGSRMTYSNCGFGLLGMIVERAEGRAYADLVREKIFQPLGMTGACPIIRTTDRARYAVGYHPFMQDRPVRWPSPLCPADWVDFDESSGSIAATPADMARYARYLIAAGSGKGAPLLSDASATFFTKPSILSPDFGPKAQYAAGIAVVEFDGRPLIHHTGGMIAFSSSIHIDAPAGTACFASTNCNIEGYRPRQISAYATQLLRAVREGRPLPQPPVIDVGDTIKEAASYTGRFTSASGESFEIRTAGEGLAMVYQGKQVPIQRKGGALLAAHPRFDLYLVDVVRKDGKATDAWWGPTHFSAGGTPQATPVPAELQALAGRYDNDDPWLGTFRIVARPDGLYLGGTDRIAKLADGSWGDASDKGSPERFRFDAIVNGQALRLNFSGVDFWRKPEPV
jgi:CubicO group peptidase (beta-lactamase class C family)